MKKIFLSMFLIVFGFYLIGCETLIEYASLSLMTNDEKLSSAYVSTNNGEKIIIDFTELKEKDFYKNVMESSAEPTDTLPEVEPFYSLIISSDNNILQIDDLGALYAKYKEEWYKIKCSTEDKTLLYNYLLLKEEVAPNDPLQIIRNEDGKIVFNVVALNTDTYNMNCINLQNNGSTDIENKDQLFSFLFEKLHGKESVYDYTNCSMDYTIEITYNVYDNFESKLYKYEFKFHKECGTMTILKNKNLVGTVILSSEEVNSLFELILSNNEKTFNEILGYTINSASKIIIDEGPGSIAPPWLHSVSEINDINTINLFLEYLNNAKFIETELMTGLGTKEILIMSNDKEYEISFTNRNQLYYNGKLYEPTTSFPELNMDLIYQYYEHSDVSTINIFGEELEIPNDYFKDIKFLPYSPKLNLTFATKFGIIKLDGLSIMLTSVDTFMDSYGGTYVIVGDKDFSDLLKDVNTETVRVLVKVNDGYLYTIIVSKNTIYTQEELRKVIPQFDPYILVKEDGSEFEYLLITDDITLIFIR